MLVVIKLAVLVLFIVLGATALQSANYTPFFTGSTTGTLSAAALIFFAYIGFDAISTSTYLRCFIWMGIGLIIYFAYRRRHSLLQRGTTPAEEPTGG